MGAPLTDKSLILHPPTEGPKAGGSVGRMSGGERRRIERRVGWIFAIVTWW
jgi:hypothetical protein